jgi:hypothetical protein
MGINILILPAVFLLLSIPILLFFLKSAREIVHKRMLVILAVLIVSWFLGGASLMLLDYLFKIRFRIV